MRDRLIELIISADISLFGTDKPYAEVYADHLLANGVIVPPCKVGDTVYKVVRGERVKKPYECKVIGLWYSEDENWSEAHLVRYVNGEFDCSFTVPLTDFGKTVFLTREEAEKALKERERDA